MSITIRNLRAWKAEGYYVVVDFTADPDVLTELERTLRLADEVLRFKIVVRGEAA